MDPLAALGVASNILTFIDFSQKLISSSCEVYSSTTGATDENVDLRLLTHDLQALTERLCFDGDAISAAADSDAASLRDLASKCRGLSNDLLKLLRRLETKNEKSRLESFRVALRSLQKKGELESLEKRLSMYRRQIFDRVLLMMR
jgi:hypothetical protein